MSVYSVGEGTSDFTREEIREVAEHIEVQVRGGLEVSRVCEKLGRGVFRLERSLVLAGRAEYERRIRKVDTWPGGDDEAGGGTLTSTVAGWYGGPCQDDYFWPPLRNRLSAELNDALEGIDSSSSRVVGLGSPPGSETIDTRGLVLGYVQSGKTTNFMSVIAKAADVGYRLVIVLSGITENLRQQTQERIGEYVVDPCSARFHLLTTSDHDFAKTTNPNALLSNKDLRLLAVVKKNPARLRRLNAWLNRASSTTIAQLPILVIDDEADQASIDVGSKRQSTINALIGEVLSHPKAAYIAYTATPFANLLIDPADVGGLYPRHFIVNLPKPDAYFGPERLFGTLEHDEGETPDDGMDVVRTVSLEDVDTVRPPKKKDDLETWAPDIPDSLRRSLLWFVLATTVRRRRSGETKHSSMLVHTSMLARAHMATAASIEEELEDIRADFQRADRRLEAEIRLIWSLESARVKGAEFGNEDYEYEELRKGIEETLFAVDVVVDNYLSSERLNYDDKKPATVIVVGGNTLSRGLTLEGLISSYFIRASTAYDTLLQMGRWFGYRRGYEDLVRVWMTNELRQWFIALATVELEIRRDIEVYARENKTPLQVPVRIRTHPQMAITSAAKMGAGTKTSVSYSGRKVQTILFRDQDSKWLLSNQKSVINLVETALEQGHSERELGSSIRGFKGLNVESIIAFMNSYLVHEDARTIDTESITRYIGKQNEQGALKGWNVVFVERRDGVSSGLNLGLSEPLKMLRRRKIMTNDDGTANLKAITSRWDRVADLSLSKQSIADTFFDGQQTKVNDEVLKLVRRQQGLGRTGLLVIYPINKNSEIDPQDEAKNDQSPQGESVREPLQAKEHLIGVSILFPEAENQADTVDYYSAPVTPGYLEDADSEAEAADFLDEKRASEEEAQVQ